MKKYIIQSGDSLATIAQRFYGDPSRYQDIARANNITNPNVISVGQELLLPGIAIEESHLTADPAVHFSTDDTAPAIFSIQTLHIIMPQATMANLVKYEDSLNREIFRFNISTPLRAAHFIAQLAHESGSFNHSSENLNYSARGLRSVFGRYFPDEASAGAYARNPQKIANRVYASRMGNGDEQSGDGWKFRGRGLIQLTGKDNYTRCGAALQLDLLNNPDLLATNPDAAVAAAAWFWNMRNLNNLADNDDIENITRRINGGLHGIDERKAFLAKAKAVLHI